MALRQIDFFVAGQGPQNRNFERFDGLGHEAAMTRTSNPVQDHPGDLYAWVEAGAALDNRRRGLRLSAGVDHKQDRPA